LGVQRELSLQGELLNERAGKTETKTAIDQSYLEALKESFRGDYMNYKMSGPVTTLLHSWGDKGQILFCDQVEKWNRHNSKKVRVLLLTEEAIYNIDPKKLQCKREVRIKHVRCISLSRDASDIIVIHHTKAHDQIISTPKRAEFVYFLQRACFDLYERTIPHKYAERLYVNDKHGTVRDVYVPNTQTVKIGRTFGLLQ